MWSNIVSRASEDYSASLVAPAGDVEAGSAVTIEADLERVTAAPPPGPLEETSVLRLNGVALAEQKHIPLQMGDTVSFVVSGLGPDNSPLQFGENVVTIESTAFNGSVEAGRFQLVEQAATVTNLSSNKDVVFPGEFFRLTVVHVGNLDHPVDSRLVVNTVERDTTGVIVNETTVYTDTVTSDPGSNTEEFAVRLPDMSGFEELCAFLERGGS